MIISEKQIMLLMDYAHIYLSRLCQENTPSYKLQDLISLLYDIADQQSDELKEIE